MSPAPVGSVKESLSGDRLGSFDVSINPALDRQVTVGSLAHNDAGQFYDVWTRFEGRRKVKAAKVSLLNYRIDSELSPDLKLDVRARADISGDNSDSRSLELELSTRLKVSEVLVDGRIAEFLQQQAPAFSGAFQRRNGLVVALLPEPLSPGAKHELEVRYSGNVISEEGSGVYYVGDRGAWCPRASPGFSHFELNFEYPGKLELVATGTQVEDSISRGVRTTRFKTENPIRLAGFNLGDYASKTRKAGDYEIRVLATKRAYAGLRGAPDPVSLPASPTNLPNERRSTYGLRPPPAPEIIGDAETVDGAFRPNWRSREA